MSNHVFRAFVGGLALAAPMASFALDQYANKVVDFSTQYTDTRWSAAQALNKPNTQTYGDIDTAWTTSTAEAGAEYITVSYPVAVFSTGATVRETFGYGFVVGIDAIDTAGVSHVVWTGPDNGLPNQINELQATWKQTTYLVASLRVRIDTSLHSGYEEIDSIQLHGQQPLSGTLTPLLGHSLNLTCANQTTAQTVTTTVNGPGANGAVTAWDCQSAGLKVKAGNAVDMKIAGKIAANYAIDQYATKVEDFSTQYTTTRFSAAQALKKPDTFSYGDIATAWTTSTPDAGAEFITVSYLNPVYASGLTIRETFGYGFVTGVDAIDTAGVSHTVWSGPDNGLPNQINEILASWTPSKYLVSAVKVRIDTSLHAGYEEIDSLQLHGKQSFSGTVAPRFGHTMTLTCRNTTTSQVVTKLLKGPGSAGAVTAWDCQAIGLTFSAGNNVEAEMSGTLSK